MKIWLILLGLAAVCLLTVGYALGHFKQRYQAEVDAAFRQSAPTAAALLTEQDLAPHPDVVRRYIRYSGAVGKPKVHHFSLELDGRLRQERTSPWIPFHSEQYNFIAQPARLFFLQATMKHLPVAGLHCYKDGHAFMDIRLLSLFRVAYRAGREMDTAETVTFFNDMCCFAPATLIDRRISWLDIYPDKVKAAFSSNGIRITAWLYFDEAGALTNFVSADRYAAGPGHTMVRVPWHTPLDHYEELDGRRLATHARAVYRYIPGDFCYGEFTIRRVRYNSYKSAPVAYPPMTEAPLAPY